MELKTGEPLKKDLEKKLEFKNVSKSYGSICVFRNFSLTVWEGEVLVFVGPSGCGKTTLLRLVAGLDRPDEGEIILYQENGKSMTVQAPGRDRVMVFQGQPLFPWLSVRENVFFAWKNNSASQSKKYRRFSWRNIKSYFLKGMRNMTSSDIQHVQKYIDMVGLTGYEDAYPHMLSGGMRQRVALAMALSTHPDILLMDEPFGALDAETRENLQNQLIYIQEHLQLTVLFVTHDIEEAIYLGDRIAILSHKPTENKPAHIIDANKEFLDFLLKNPLKNKGFKKEQVQRHWRIRYNIKTSREFHKLRYDISEILQSLSLSIALHDWPGFFPLFFMRRHRQIPQEYQIPEAIFFREIVDPKKRLDLLRDGQIEVCFMDTLEWLSFTFPKHSDIFVFSREGKPLPFVRSPIFYQLITWPGISSDTPKNPQVMSIQWEHLTPSRGACGLARLYGITFKREEYIDSEIDAYSAFVKSVEENPELPHQIVTREPYITLLRSQFPEIIISPLPDAIKRKLMIIIIARFKRYGSGHKRSSPQHPNSFDVRKSFTSLLRTLFNRVTQFTSTPRASKPANPFLKIVYILLKMSYTFLPSRKSLRMEYPPEKKDIRELHHWIDWVRQIDERTWETFWDSITWLSLKKDEDFRWADEHNTRSYFIKAVRNELRK